MFCNNNVFFKVDTGSSGRFSYFIESLLNDEKENIAQVISNNKKHEYLFILSKKCDVWPIGPEYEPMRIVVKFFDKSFKINEVSFTFTKCSLITHVKEEISQILLCDLNEGSEKKFELSNLIFTLVQANKNEKTVLEASQYDHKSLSDALIKNGDCITIELKDF